MDSPPETLPQITPTPGQVAYRWHTQSIFAGRQPDLEVENYLNLLDKEGWEIVTVVPRGEALLVIARKPRPQEHPHA